MISKLFQKLASLPGINLFNHRDKMEIAPELPFHPPTGEESYDKIKEKANKYFKHLVVQNQYIKALHKLLDQVDDEVMNWDRRQAAHEQDIVDATRPLLKEINNLKMQVRHWESKKFTRVIESKEVDKLIAYLGTLTIDGPYVNKKELVRANKIHQTLHNFLHKLRTYLPEVEESKELSLPENFVDWKDVTIKTKP